MDYCGVTHVEAVEVRRVGHSGYAIAAMLHQASERSEGRFDALHGEERYQSTRVGGEQHHGCHVGYPVYETAGP